MLGFVKGAYFWKNSLLKCFDQIQAGSFVLFLLSRDLISKEMESSGLQYALPSPSICQRQVLTLI